jgi:hypothetical protein
MKRQRARTADGLLWKKSARKNVLRSKQNGSSDSYLDMYIKKYIFFTRADK